MAQRYATEKSNTMSGKNGSFPQSDKLAKIAISLDCTVDYLLGLTDEPKMQNNTITHQDEQRQRLNDNYDALNRIAQKALVDYSDFMTTKPENLKESYEDNKNVSWWLMLFRITKSYEKE